MQKSSQRYLQSIQGHIKKIINSDEVDLISGIKV
jgi:hypothetical protein